MNWMKTSYGLMKKHGLLSVFYPWAAMMAWCVVVLVFYPSCT